MVVSATARPTDDASLVLLVLFATTINLCGDGSTLESVNHCSFTRDSGDWSCLDGSCFVLVVLASTFFGWQDVRIVFISHGKVFVKVSVALSSRLRLTASTCCVAIKYLLCRENSHVASFDASSGLDYRNSTHDPTRLTSALVLDGTRALATPVFACSSC